MAGDSRLGKGPFRAYRFGRMDWKGRLESGSTIYGCAGMLFPTAAEAKRAYANALRALTILFLGLLSVGSIDTFWGFYPYVDSPLLVFSLLSVVFSVWGLALLYLRYRKEPRINTYRVISGTWWTATLECIA